ncbi:hypothetical protein J5N97_016687 [Dioscorea zingiberensis]|uniref:Large ribosomal subunit protein uL6 alpha-beta domain-containing protein n=1 Tax=Dioscorea zingiberensis TaxID=325984 RepID=A0A9D5CKC5_9LILI|nr:hypothetical protein J5N97_016687 [Dioscorea zingiberensis]
MASLSATIPSCNLKSGFLGEMRGFRVPSSSISRVGILKKPVECKESRIGKQPIEVPSNVTITLEGQDLKVKGPLGELSRTYPREVKLEREDSGILKVSKALDTRRANQMHGLFRTLTDNMVVGVSKGFEKRLQMVGVGYRAMELSRTYPREVKLEREDSGILKVSKALDTRRANQMHGLFRTLTDNMVVGVSKGFEKRLQMVGVGYRAMLEGNDLVLNLGFSHPVRMAIPNGLKVKVEDNTKIVVAVMTSAQSGEVCCFNQKVETPEPYKGKGFYPVKKNEVE